MIRTVEVIREHAAKALNDIDFTYNVRYSKNIVVHVGNTSTVHDLGGGARVGWGCLRLWRVIGIWSCATTLD